MVAGAAGDDMDVGNICQAGFGFRTEDCGQNVIVAEGAGQGVADRLGLLEDLLEHEVAVLALVQAVRGVLVTCDRTVHAVVLAIPDFALLAVDACVVAFFQIAEAVSHLEQGERVGGQVVFAAALADD